MNNLDRNDYFSRMKQRWIEYKTEIKSLPEERRKKKQTILIAYAIGCLIVAALFSGYFIGMLAILFTGSKAHGVIYYAFLNPIGLIATVFFFGLFIFGAFALEFRRNLNNGEMLTDDRGVTYMRNSTQGSSRFMNEKETKENFYVGDVLETTETIYGQLTDNGEEVVAYKTKQGGSGNKNLLLLGSPGTGKSYCYVRTEIIQSALRGSSIIVTDPSAELYTDIGQFLRDYGYDVKILNLVEPRYSDFWNCMEEVIDPDTKRLDGSRLNDFTEIYMSNIGEVGAKKDAFWSEGSTNLFRAVIGQASWRRESEILKKYRDLYAKVADKNPDKALVLDQKMKNMVPFSWCEEQILENAKKYGFDVNEIQKEIEKINISAKPFNIQEVYNILMDFNNNVGEFDTMPPSHPGLQAYKIYNTGSETVKASTLQGTQLKLQIFSDDKLCSLLCNKGIDIPNINLKKSAYFVIMSEKTTTTRPIASLFFSFFFKDAMDNWDKYSKIADAKGEKCPCYDVTVMLDEFFSIGVIGGNPNSFATTLSVNRKRHLSVNIIVQSITQLIQLYGKENAATIQTCCDWILFLGCNDPETAKFISDFVGGKSTVLNESHAESLNPIGTLGDGTNLRMSSTQRALLTVDEARRWKDRVLLTKRGELPLKLKMFPWHQHPCAINGELKRVPVYDVLKPIEERVTGIVTIAKENTYYDQSKQQTKIASKYEKEKKNDVRFTRKTQVKIIEKKGTNNGEEPDLY